MFNDPADLIECSECEYEFWPYGMHFPDRKPLCEECQKKKGVDYSV